jgi:hypothetical protein
VFFCRKEHVRAFESPGGLRGLLVLYLSFLRHRSEEQKCKSCETSDGWRLDTIRKGYTTTTTINHRVKELTHLICHSQSYLIYETKGLTESQLWANQDVICCDRSNWCELRGACSKAIRASILQGFQLQMQSVRSSFSG